MGTRQYDMSDYPWWLFTRIAAHVEAGSHGDAHQDLDTALDRMEHEHGPELGPRTMRCSAVLSHALRGAYSGGAPSEPILVTYMETLDTMAEASSWIDVRHAMHRALDRLLDEVRTNYKGDVDQLVDTIRTTMREDPAAVRSLSEYAYANHLHADYLSRRFHSIAGQTFTVERRLFRIRAAERLLRKTSLKVRAVAKQVGYNDPSRFIADFRQVVGETPATYRKAAMESILHRMTVRFDISKSEFASSSGESAGSTMRQTPDASRGGCRCRSQWRSACRNGRLRSGKTFEPGSPGFTSGRSTYS